MVTSKYWVIRDESGFGHSYKIKKFQNKRIAKKYVKGHKGHSIWSGGFPTKKIAKENI